MSKWALGFHGHAASPAWKRTREKLDVELLLFVSFEASAEGKENRNESAALTCWLLEEFIGIKFEREGEMPEKYFSVRRWDSALCSPFING